MKLFRYSTVVALLASVCLAQNAYAGSSKDGNAATAMEYHHPNVVKALAFTERLNGRNAVAADLRGTIQHFSLEFVDNQLESRLIKCNSAVDQHSWNLFEAAICPGHERVTKTGGTHYSDCCISSMR